MKRTVLHLIAVACFGLLASTAELASATTLGLNAAPLGNRADATVKYAFWDTFTQTQVPSTTTYTFNGVADGNSTLTNLSLTQTAAHAIGAQGAGLLIPTGGPVSDVYYSSTQPHSWILNATAAIDISAISFQIKTANVNESVISQLFTPTLTGEGVGAYYTSAPVAEPPLFGGFTNYVIEYRWSGLDIPAGTPLAITFALAGGPSGSNFAQKPVDFVSLDVSSVPEPSSMVLLGIGAVTLYGLRRRFKSC
ncbi:MAG: PEP-CTERM sorting domain-containing protein [Planctomycetota bacterium]|nr:PEP-CTERM sorting domain-containing protein [Planctomycetota bacterium]